MPARTGLTAKQRRFVDEYLVDLNATQAAIRAGYKRTSAEAQGHENLRKPEIAAEIQKHQAQRALRTGITQDRVLRELARIAFGDARRLLTWRGSVVVLNDSSTLTDDDAATVAKVKKTRDGVSIEMHDKLRALELIGRHLGTFKEGAGDGGDDLPMPARVAVERKDASVPRD